MNKNVSLFQLYSSVPVERHGNEANFRKWIESWRIINTRVANNGRPQIYIYITVPVLIIVAFARSFACQGNFKCDGDTNEEFANNIDSNICRLFRRIWQILIIRFHEENKFLIIDRTDWHLIRAYFTNVNYILTLRYITKKWNIESLVINALCIIPAR